MKERNIEKVKADTVEWSYRQNLPSAYRKFALRQLDKAMDDRWELFAYVDENSHAGVMAYFHEETMEYKLRLKRGLIEYCDTNFISGDLKSFTEQLAAHLFTVLDNLAEFKPESVHFLLARQGILTWEYGRNLPEKKVGFTLVTRPTEPYLLSNGSYVVLDYTDFDISSNFNIYYNIFRGEYFGESRINMVPEVTYDFDVKDLTELEQKLAERLENKLEKIRIGAQKN